MGFYKKKPVIIEAVQFNDITEVAEFIGGNFGYPRDYFKKGITIETLEGDMKAFKGDWIIKGIKGEFYPCKDDIFKETYEPVEENNFKAYVERGGYKLW